MYLRQLRASAIFFREIRANDNLEEFGNVDNNQFFMNFVVDPSDEIAANDVSIDKKQFFRSFSVNPDKEMLEDNGCVDKDSFIKPFLVDPYDQIVEIMALFLKIDCLISLLHTRVKK